MSITLHGATSQTTAIFTVSFVLTDQKVDAFRQVLVVQSDDFPPVNQQWRDVQENTLRGVTVIISWTRHPVHRRFRLPPAQTDHMLLSCYRCRWWENLEHGS
jgi:hypothetical protein